jgi:hypothetical protein
MRLTALVLGALLLAPVRLVAQSQDKSKDPPAPPCTPKAGRAVVRGSLVDSATALPLDGAGIVLHWTTRGDTQKKEGETDHEGRFRMCDAPLGTPVMVQANFWGAHVETRLEAQTDTSGAPLALSVDAPHSLLQGRVLDQSSQAVSGASVRIAGLADARVTDPDGTFDFGRVPPGTYRVTVEHLAYKPVTDTVEVDFSTRVDATIHVAPDVIALAPISIEVHSLVLQRNGFYDRQKYGHGAFITRQQIEKEHVQESADVLRRVAGIRMQGPGRLGDRNVATARAGCPMRYIIDGTRTSTSYSIDYVSLGDIEGIEVYLGPSQVPSEYAAFPGETGGGCGLIIIWTRQNVKI